jgi:hypothetical protein
MSLLSKLTQRYVAREMGKISNGDVKSALASLKNDEIGIIINAFLSGDKALIGSIVYDELMGSINKTAKNKSQAIVDAGSLTTEELDDLI